MLMEKNIYIGDEVGALLTLIHHLNL